MSKIPKEFPIIHQRSPLWNFTRRLLPSMYQLELAEQQSRTTRSRSRHYIGGESTHRGAKCRECKRKLFLLVDLDLADDIFVPEVRDGLKPATRLPLYICWHCLGCSYRIERNKSIKVLDDRKIELTDDENCPFRSLPTELERREVVLSQVPFRVEAMLAAAGQPGIFIDEESKANSPSSAVARCSYKVALICRAVIRNVRFTMWTNTTTSVECCCIDRLHMSLGI